MLENDDLRAALRRVEPPAGFEHRVLARLGEERPLVRPRTPYTAWLAAAAMACASIAGIVEYRYEQRQREYVRAIDARDQLLQALQITGKTLDSVREQINKEEQTQ